MPVPEYFLERMEQEAQSDGFEGRPKRQLQKDTAASAKYAEQFKIKYKTEMCKNWQLTGHCEFDDSCSFAHGEHELKEKTDVPRNYKTKPCKRYHRDMYCPYGKRCQFLHGERDAAIVAPEKI